ncbi:MAG: hypothetical protein COB76_06220, partial [Alphaproteobacteria bacterium]
ALCLSKLKLKPSKAPFVIALSIGSFFAFIFVSQIYGEIESLDNKIPAKMQIEALDEIGEFLDYATTWFLKLYRDEKLKEKDLLAKSKHYKKAIEKLRKGLSKNLPASTQAFIDGRKDNYIKNGLPKAIAEQLALLPVLNTACDIIRIADEEKQDVATVARVYFGLNEAFSFVWLRDEARGLEPESRYESDTLKGLTDRLYGTQARLTKRIVAETCNTKKCPKDPVGEWITHGNGSVQTILDAVKNMKDSEQVDFAMLTSIEIRLAQLG